MDFAIVPTSIVIVTNMIVCVHINGHVLLCARGRRIGEKLCGKEKAQEVAKAMLVDFA